MSKDTTTKATTVKPTEVKKVETSTVEEAKDTNTWNFEPAIDKMLEYLKLQNTKDSEGKIITDNILIPIDYKGVRQHFVLSAEDFKLDRILRDAIGNMFYRSGNKKAIDRFKINQVPTMSFNAKSKARKTKVEKVDDNMEALRKQIGDKAFKEYIKSLQSRFIG